MSSSKMTPRFEKLQDLAKLLAQEREAAKHLDVQGLENATKAKEELLGVLQEESPPIQPEEEALVHQIQYELRRNAYFFQQALAWVQESVQVVRGEEAPQAYSSAGGMVGSSRHGRLLSGRV